MDDEFQTGGRPSSSGGLSGSAAAGSGASKWAHLGSFEQTRKENVQQAGTWAGALQRQFIECHLHIGSVCQYSQDNCA